MRSEPKKPPRKKYVKNDGTKRNFKKDPIDWGLVIAGLEHGMYFAEVALAARTNDTTLRKYRDKLPPEQRDYIAYLAKRNRYHVAECGTYAAYSRHRRKGEDPDLACRVAYADYMRDLRRRREVDPESIGGCGTEVGYQRHLSKDEKPCWGCRKAHARHKDAERAQAKNEKRAAERARLRKQREACGTPSGWWRHKDLNEEPCRRCRRAQSEHLERGRRRAQAEARKSPETEA